MFDTGAGFCPAGVKRFDFPRLPGRGHANVNQGTNTLHDTPPAMMSDHLIRLVTHTFMMNNPRVIREVITFLNTGAFDRSLTWFDAVLEQIGCPGGSCVPGIGAQIDRP